MLSRPKYKFLIKLRQNIWNTSKPLKFKRLKWKKIKRVLFIDFYKERRKFFKRKYFFLNNFRRRNFFNLLLNTKKIFVNLFGPLKRNQMSYIIRKSIGKGIVKKVNFLGFNQIGVKNIKYNDTLYLMRSLELTLLATLLRSGIFSNIFIYLHFIKSGCVLINGIVIKNPFFKLNLGDIITLDINLLKKIFNNIDFFDNKELINVKSKLLKKRKFKKQSKINVCKSKHIIKIIGKNFFKLIVVKYPEFSDIEFFGMFDWGIVCYLLKLKR